MTRRYKAIVILVVLAAMATTLAFILRETTSSEQYGMAKIRLARQTVYVKSRKCAAGCSGGMWLSRSSDRCRPPDPATDYTINFNQVVYARQDDTLLLIENPRAVVLPTGGDWIDMKFLAPYDHATSTLPLRSIMFGEHLPTRNVPREQVDLGPCVRAFGRDW